MVRRIAMLICLVGVQVVVTMLCIVAIMVTVMREI